ncbi:MAG: histidinol phosphate phosphatase domain-containing protein [Planctomycetaceae bacterium]|nr:MAG: histidinol phosphate phosphatase domain-containing protein [Planctomycetaceae bacterium]
MIDFHTHTTLSDGELIPAEQIRRAEVRGYRMLGISDHADLGTMTSIIPMVVEAARRENELGRMKVFGGVELTYVRPVHIAEFVGRARELGAAVVIAHGETIAEPVEPGTNRTAIEAGVDILAHPGLLSLDDARLAARRGVLLEISGKAGHSLCNGHVAQIARAAGAKLIFGSDAHNPAQMPDRAQAERICRGAGLSDEEVQAMFANAEQFGRRIYESIAKS